MGSTLQRLLSAETLVAHAADALVAFDMQRNVIFWNPAAERLYGIPAAEMLGRPYSDAFQYENLDGNIQHEMAQSIFRTGAWIGDSIHIMRDGRRVLVESSVTLLNDTDSTPTAILAVIRDVTSRRQREFDRIEETREREFTLRTLIDSIPDRVYLKDLNGRYLLRNRIASKDIDKDPNEYIGKDDFDLFPPDVAAEYQRTDHQVLETLSPTIFEEETWSPHGPRWLQTAKNVCRTPEGKVLGVVGIGRDITDRKQLESTLRERERELQQAYRIAGIGTWHWTIETDFTQWTEETYRIFGYDPALPPPPYMEIVERHTPPSRARLQAAVRRAVEQGTPYEFDMELTNPDGSTSWIISRGEVTASQDGRPTALGGTVQDITERKRAEARIALSEARLRTLIKVSSEIVWTTTPGGAQVNDLPDWQQFTGRDPEAWEDAIHPEDRQRSVQSWQRSLATGEMLETEERLRRHDGVFRNMLVRGVPVRDEAGTIIEWVGMHTDITDQKVAEQTLREREQRFRALADSLPQLIWESAPTGGNIFCNQRFLDYTGLSHEQFMDWRFLDIIHPEDLTRTRERWNQSLSTGVPYLNEYRLRRHDGEFRSFLARAVPVINQQGQIERWIGTATDVHDQKIAEEALRRSEKLATAGRLAASVAHEINNPLEAVTNALYLALHDQTLTHETREYLQLAERELARVAHVATQTLRFHRQSHSAAPADLADLMDSVFELFAQRFRTSDIEVTRTYSITRRLVCFSDELRQVFANLVGNALDATPRGGRLIIRIHDSCLRPPGQPSQSGVRILVADSGSGIPPHLLKKIFEPFVSTKEATGTGLGLWVSEGIIRKHHGHIAVRSKPGIGTVFNLFFPHDVINKQFDPAAIPPL